MCLAIPGTIIKIEGDTAMLDYGGTTREASVVLFPDAAAGDRALVHAGFIIQILKGSDGEELQRLVDETIGYSYD